MDYSTIPITVIILVILFIVLKPYIDSTHSITLHSKFISLGNMVGKSLSEIATKVGMPSISETLSDGFLYTWDSTKYAIKLKFDQNNICVGKVSEISKK